jgi:flagellar biosynthesis protein FliR
MSFSQLIARFGEQHVLGFFLVLARLSPLFLVAPLFSSKMIPARSRSIIAVGLAIGIAPLALKGVAAGATVPSDPFALGLLIVKEMLVGLALGYGLAAMFAALTTAAAILDMAIGFSFSSLVDPVNGVMGGVINQLYALFGTAIFVAINGDAWVLKGLARSYDAIPLLGTPKVGTLVEGAQVAFSGILGAAIEVAAPVLLAAVLCDCAFGLVSRVVPQLNVFGVGFPAKIAVSMLVMAATLPFMAGWMSEHLDDTVLQALRVLQVAG